MILIDDDLRNQGGNGDKVLGLALLTSLLWHCLLGLAPVYLRELCCPLLSAMSSQSLAHSNREYSLSILPVPPLGRTTHSPLWACQHGATSF